MKTLRLSAALAALTLTVSTACAAVIDLSNPLGPSGRYTSQAQYQVMLGGQPMTAAQQAYSNQEDHLRQMGFLSELRGDVALGQAFYHMAYGIVPPSPPSALEAASGGSGLVTGASEAGYTGSVVTDGRTDAGYTSGFLSYGGAGLDLTMTAIVVPEASTWAMMLVGFASLGAVGWRSTKQLRRA